jgi:hypothetical protein
MEAPFLQGFGDGVKVACGHVSGLNVRSVTSGLDGIRGSPPIQADELSGRRVSPNPLPTDHAICFTPAAIAAHAAYAGPLLSSQTDVSGNNVRFVSD